MLGCGSKETLSGCVVFGAFATSCSEIQPWNARLSLFQKVQQLGRTAQCTLWRAPQQGPGLVLPGEKLSSAPTGSNGSFASSSSGTRVCPNISMQQWKWAALWHSPKWHESVLYAGTDPTTTGARGKLCYLQWKGYVQEMNFLNKGYNKRWLQPNKRSFILFQALISPYHKSIKALSKYTASAFLWVTHTSRKGEDTVTAETS